MSEFDPVLPPGCTLSMKGWTGWIRKGWVRLKFQQEAYQFSRRYRPLDERGGGGLTDLSHVARIYTYLYSIHL